MERNMVIFLCTGSKILEKILLDIRYDIRLISEPTVLLEKLNGCDNKSIIFIIKVNFVTNFPNK